MKYLFAMAFALFTLFPSAASATQMAGFIDSTFVDAPTHTINTFPNTAYRLYSILIDGTEGSASYQVNYEANDWVSFEMFEAIPDASDLSLHQYDYGNFSTADTRGWILNTEVTYYLLFRPYDSQTTPDFSFSFDGSDPLIITQEYFEGPAVPEPSTLALVACGIGGILYRKRRR